MSPPFEAHSRDLNHAVESLQGLIRKARDAGYGVTLFIVAAGEDDDPTLGLRLSWDEDNASTRHCMGMAVPDAR